jgi:hypothetical protein
VQGVKIRPWCWVYVLVGSSQSFAAAQDVGQAAKEDAPKPVRRFFDRPVDLWRSGLEFRSASENAREKGKGTPPAGEDWGQMVRLPDGQMAYRELPKPLVKLLEDPSAENVRAYFDWRLERTRKILTAAERIKEYRESQAPRHAPEAQAVAEVRAPEPNPRGEGQDVSSAAQSPSTVLYFHQASCPHCDRQDRVLAPWISDNAAVKLDVVEGGTRPELWRKYRIRGTPSLVFLPPGGGEQVLIEGFADRDRLDRALKESTSPKPAVTVERGEKP